MAQSDLLLLHGALGASEQFSRLMPLLADRFQLHRLDFEGHGGAPARDRPFRIEHFAENVIDYLDAQAIARIDIFGYSMGGYVALYLARTQPDRIGRIATLGTKLMWAPEVAAREVKMLDPKTIAEKVPNFARALEARHTASGWENVLARTVEMMIALGDRPALSSEDYAAIEARVRICVGDRDATVGVEESAAVYRLLPHGELDVLPGAPHPLEKAPLDRLARGLVEFF